MVYIGYSPYRIWYMLGIYSIWYTHIYVYDMVYVRYGIYIHMQYGIYKI